MLLGSTRRQRVDTTMKRGPAQASLSSKTTGDAPPSNLIDYSTTMIGDSLCIFGGRLDPSPSLPNPPSSSTPAPTLSSSLYRLNLPSNHWNKLWPREQSVDTALSTQLARSHHSAVGVHGDHLVISGGRSDSPSFAPVVIWDCEEEEWIVPPSHPSSRRRYDHISVVSEGGEGEATLLMMGGFDDSGNEVVGVDAFDLERMEWVEGDIDGLRGYSLGDETSAAVSREIIEDRSFSGATDSTIIYTSAHSESQLISLNHSSTSFEAITLRALGLPTLSHSHLSSIGHFLVLFGFRSTTAQLWILDIDRLHDGYEVEWTPVALPPAGRGSHSAWSNGGVWNNQYVLLRRDLNSIALVSLSPFGIITRPAIPTPTPESIVMHQLFKDPSLVDFDFVCMDGIVKARKLILASRWEWFRNEIRKSPYDSELALPLSTAALSILVEYYYTNAFPHTTSGSALLELLLFTQSPRCDTLHSWIVYGLFEALRNGLVSPMRKEVEVAIFEATLTTAEATVMGRVVKVMMEKAPLLREDRRRPDSTCSSILDSFPQPNSISYPSPPNTASTDSTMLFGSPYESSPHAYAAIMPATPPITPQIRTIRSPIDAWKEEDSEESGDYLAYLSTASSSSMGSPVVSYLPSFSPPHRTAPLPPLPPAPLQSSTSSTSTASITPTTRGFLKEKKAPKPIKAKPVLVSMYDIKPPAKPFVSIAFPAVYDGYVQESKSAPMTPAPKNEFLSPSPKKPSRFAAMLRSRSAPDTTTHQPDSTDDNPSSLISFPPLLEVTTHSTGGTSYFDDRSSYDIRPRTPSTNSSFTTYAPANSSPGHPAGFLSAFKMRGNRSEVAREVEDGSTVEMLSKGDYFDSTL